MSKSPTLLTQNKLWLFCGLLAASQSQGTLDQFWLWGMQAGLKNAYESIKAFFETDFTEELRKIVDVANSREHVPRWWYVHIPPSG